MLKIQKNEPYIDEMILKKSGACQLFLKEQEKKNKYGKTT